MAGSSGSDGASDLPSPTWENRLVQICAENLSSPGAICRPEDLASCWSSESDLKSSVMNPNGFATGLFQLTPDTAEGLGWRAGDTRWADIRRHREARKAAKDRGDTSAADMEKSAILGIQKSLMREFGALSPLDQLEWARIYYQSSKGLLTSPGACYVKTFLPAEMPHASDPTWVLTAKPGVLPQFPLGKYSGPQRDGGDGRVDAYTPNKGAFDPTGRGFITVQDLTDRIHRATSGSARWNAILPRIKAADAAYHAGVPEVLLPPSTAFILPAAFGHVVAPSASSAWVWGTVAVLAVAGVYLHSKEVAR